MKLLTYSFLATIFTIIFINNSPFVSTHYVRFYHGGNLGNQKTGPGGINVTQYNGTIDEYLASNQSNFSTIAAALNQTGITFNNTNATLFAANDDAFQSLPQWITQLFQNVSVNSSVLPVAQAILLYHIHPKADFSPKNFTAIGGNQTANSSSFFANVFNILEGGGNGGSSGNQSANATSLSTALKPFNLTIYKASGGNQTYGGAPSGGSQCPPASQSPGTAQEPPPPPPPEQPGPPAPPSPTPSPSPQPGQNQSNATQWWVNDAQINAAINTTNGYIFDISRVVTPLYYLNSSIYLIKDPPPQLGQNYTFPLPPQGGPTPVNLTSEEMEALNYEKAWNDNLVLSYTFGLV